MVMRFPAKKNAGCPKALRDFPPRKDGILPPPVGMSWNSPPPPLESVRASADVTIKIFRIDRLPDLFTHGAPRALL